MIQHLTQRPVLLKAYTFLNAVSKSFTRTAVSNTNSTTCDVSISEDQRTLTLTPNNSDPMRFYSNWLRHNCHSPSSRQESSGQRLLVPSLMADTYTITDVCVQENELHIGWKEEPNHVTVIPVKYLLDNNYSAETRRQYRLSITPPPQKPALTEIAYDDIMSSTEGLTKWLKELMYDGKCLVTGMPTEEGSIKHAVEKIFPIQKTIYGEIFDVVSTESAINVAYTNVALDFHMDLVYYESVPGYQFLHCIRNDACVNGGESLLVDSWDAAELLREQHPEHFNTLLRVPATFQKIHWQRENPVYMKYKRPHIVVNDEGAVIATHWAPPFEGPLSIAEEDVPAYYKAYHAYARCIHQSKTKVKLLLRPGDMMCFNNHRILHAREGFELNGGVRHLQGCYLNIDEVKSEAIVNLLKAGRQETGKRVGNHCMF